MKYAEIIEWYTENESSYKWVMLGFHMQICIVSMAIGVWEEHACYWPKMGEHLLYFHARNLQQNSPLIRNTT